MPTHASLLYFGPLRPRIFLCILTHSLHSPFTSFSIPGSCSGPASPHVLIPRGTGLSTCCPSPTRLRLGLGPGFPREDQLYPGILRHSAWTILTSISLLIPAFSLHAPPRLLPVTLRRCINAPLPIMHSRRNTSSHGFGGTFQPRVFSAQDLSASELLRTL